MSLLSELTTALSPLVPLETGMFTDTAPDRYAVLTPLADTFDLHADDRPAFDVQAVRISLYDKGNYTKIKNQIVCAVLAIETAITDRRYLGIENSTGYHHYVIDVEKQYEWERSDSTLGDDRV